MLHRLWLWDFKWLPQLNLKGHPLNLISYIPRMTLSHCAWWWPQLCAQGNINFSPGFCGIWWPCWGDRAILQPGFEAGMGCGGGQHLALAIPVTDRAIQQEESGLEARLCLPGWHLEKRRTSASTVMLCKGGGGARKFWYPWNLTVLLCLTALWCFNTLNYFHVT